jgi:hypothetical protein
LDPARGVENALRLGGAGVNPVFSSVARAAARIVEQLGKKNQTFALALLQFIKQSEENDKTQK